MNAGKARLSLAATIARTSMNTKTSLTPREKEVQTLHARGKTPDVIAIRLGMKISKVLLLLSVVPRPLV